MKKLPLPSRYKMPQSATRLDDRSKKLDILLHSVQPVIYNIRLKEALNCHKICHKTGIVKARLAVRL
jgi:hypothetical protein